MGSLWGWEPSSIQISVEICSCCSPMLIPFVVTSFNFDHRKGLNFQEWLSNMKRAISPLNPTYQICLCCYSVLLFRLNVLHFSSWESHMHIRILYLFLVVGVFAYLEMSVVNCDVVCVFLSLCRCVCFHAALPSLSTADWIMHYSEFNITLHGGKLELSIISDIHMWQTLGVIFERQSSLWKSGVIGWGNWVWKF